MLDCTLLEKGPLASYRHQRLFSCAPSLAAYRQGELSPLEIGMHVLKAVPKAQGKAGKGLAEYAEKIGKSKQQVGELRMAAEVAETCTLERTSLLDKAKSLTPIHSLPAACWPAMVAALVKHGWSAEETRQRVESVKQAIEKVADEWRDVFLPAEPPAPQSQAAASAALAQTNRHAPRGRNRTEAVLMSKLKTLDRASALAELCEAEFGITTDALVLLKLAGAEPTRETLLDALQQKTLDDIDHSTEMLALARKMKLPPKIDKHERLLSEARDRLAKIQKLISVSAVASDGNSPEAVSTKDHSTMSRDTQPSPAQVFGAGNPRVKRASEQYDSTSRRLVYPSDIKGQLHFGTKAGHDVVFEGRPAYESSQLQKAMSGAFLKHKLASQLGLTHLLSDHDRDLYRECVEKSEWVGEVSTGEGTEYYGRPKRLSSLHQKTLLSDSTSGGQYAVPYFFDVDLVTFPLLYGELFPTVDLRELATSNQVKGATLANFTISAGPSEGDSPTIALQTTAGMIGALTTNIFNATGAATIGRDFLQDSPIDLLSTIEGLYQKALLQWLDGEIANGDGTTGPLGLFNTANILTASSKNSTAGPMTVADIEGMVKTLPKQYRTKQDPVIWVASDGLYFRIRGISVSTTDQRRIFGYDYQAYMLANYPFKIQNSIAGSSLGLAVMNRYRMWRRKGMEIQVSTEGRTNILANELLVVARSRWGGQLVDPNAMVEMTNASLH